MTFNRYELNSLSNEVLYSLFWYIWDCKWNCTPQLMIKNSDILENDLLAFCYIFL